MNEMVDTKDFGSTILLLTELGRTLANSERASFWYWERLTVPVSWFRREAVSWEPR